MRHFVLYGTLGCHLCDAAEALLLPLLTADCRVECVDIGESDRLIERYGTSIPVLRRLSDAAELCWPFDAAAAQRFLVGG